MKKRIKQFFLLLLLVLFLFVGYSHYRLQGTWLRLYHYKTEKESARFSDMRLLDVDYFHVTEYSSFVGDSLEYEFFLALGQKILADLNDENQPFHMPVKTITRDSLVLANSFTTVLYRKVPDSLQQKDTIDLTNKFFRMELNQTIDTMYFFEDRLLYKSKREGRKKWHNLKYELIYLNGFCFMGSDFGTMTPIKKENNRLNFYNIFKDSIQIISAEEIKLDTTFHKEVQLYRKIVLKEREDIKQQMPDQ
jgi:hypothetical protein